MFLSTFPVSVSLMIVLDKTYDRPHCHPHLRKIVKKPWCTSCKIVFIFESRTAWNQSIFSSMDWIDSHLSTPYTQETRRTSNNAKSSRFQEGAWDLNQSWCYHIIHRTHPRSSWNLHLESTGKRIKDVMAGLTDSLKRLNMWMPPWQVNGKPRTNMDREVATTTYKVVVVMEIFVFGVWCKILAKLSKILTVSFILCEN